MQREHLKHAAVAASNQALVLGDVGHTVYAVAHVEFVGLFAIAQVPHPDGFVFGAAVNLKAERRNGVEDGAEQIGDVAWGS